ncbi:NUDIX domain-containing protein [Dyella japonica]|uniref:NUDIX domain-containing protein n=1 Tax=Dyella japonica TaxID=231455 RepID=UPI00138F04A3|nr:NUDIX domain-containing protein [Dyella japonica]
MTQHFPLSTGIFVIVRREKRVLLLGRSHTGWKGSLLNLPAGLHHGGDPLAVAAARELQKETGLMAAPDGLRLVHLMHCRSSDSGAEWLSAFFLAERWAGEPRLIEHGGHSYLGWHDPSRLPPGVMPHTAQAIKCALDGVRYSHFGWAEQLACYGERGD